MAWVEHGDTSSDTRLECLALTRGRVSAALFDSLINNGL